MIKVILISLILAASQAHAGVYKCTNAQGKIEYSDKPCSDGVRMRVDVPPDINVVPKAATPPAERQPTGVTLEPPSAPSTARSTREPSDWSAPANCQFSYYTFGDEKGKVLANNAKNECLRNNTLKAQGRGAEIH